MLFLGSQPATGSQRASHALLFGAHFFHLPSSLTSRRVGPTVVHLDSSSPPPIKQAAEMMVNSTLPLLFKSPPASSFLFMLLPTHTSAAAAAAPLVRLWSCSSPRPEGSSVKSALLTGSVRRSVLVSVLFQGSRGPCLPLQAHPLLLTMGPIGPQPHVSVRVVSRTLQAHGHLRAFLLVLSTAGSPVPTDSLSHDLLLKCHIVGEASSDPHMCSRIHSEVLS